MHYWKPQRTDIRERLKRSFGVTPLLLKCTDIRRDILSKAVEILLRTFHLSLGRHVEAIHCHFHIRKCIIKNHSEQTSVKDFNGHLVRHLCYLNVQTFVEKFFQKLLNFYSELFTCHLAAAPKQSSYIHFHFQIRICIIKNHGEQTSVKDLNDHLESHLCYLNVQTFVETFCQKLLKFYSELFTCHLVAVSKRFTVISYLASHLCYLNVHTFDEKFFQKLLNFYSDLFTCHLVAASRRFTVIFIFENALLKTRANRHQWKTLTIICRHSSAT